MEKYILAIDQGTTSTRAILFDHEGNNIHQTQREFKQYFPHPGWVEHDAMEIWASVLEVVASMFIETTITPEMIEAIGITNQRETTVLWDKTTGQPIYKAVVWQSRQSQSICDDMIKKGYKDFIYSKTGLVINPYFSASKIRWILDHAKYEGPIENVAFGTIDTWLVWKLTGGKVHATDYSNASRTLLYNIHDLCWDEELLKLFNIPKCILPEVKPSSMIYGYTDETALSGVHFRCPIAGIAGDQQASLFGETCFNKGEIKNTYGTGCFILMNTGEEAIQSKNGLLTTIAWGIDGKVQYALEGSVFVAGSSIQWLRDGLEFFKTASESEQIAMSVKDSEGVYVVPAFVGLGTPYWDNDARGTMFGLTRGTTKAHITRATLESIAYSSMDVIEVMKDEVDTKIEAIVCDGGAAANNYLMQFQADICDCEIMTPKTKETTALGAAFLAGLAVGFWKDQSDIKALYQISNHYYPQMDRKKAKKLCEGWKKAVKATMMFK